MEFYEEIGKTLQTVLEEEGLDGQNIDVNSKVLTAKEAIGETERKDYPLLTGKEYLMQAEFMGSIGQSFTCCPSAFKGSIQSLLALDFTQSFNQALLIAATNAVYRHLGRITETIHCKNDEPEHCAGSILEYLSMNYAGQNLLMVGFQPAMIDKLAPHFAMRILDLDDDNVGEMKYGVLVEHGIRDLKGALLLADVILSTGSIAANGTLSPFLATGKPTYFYGTTIAAVAEMKGLRRLCYQAK
jgi:hypothetical protein